MGTDRPTDRPTDKAGCRVACTRLKMHTFTWGMRNGPTDSWTNMLCDTLKKSVLLIIWS